MSDAEIAQEKVADEKIEEQEKKPKTTRSRGTKKKVSTKKIERSITVKSKRKRAIARASVTKGSGIIRVNSKLINTIEPRELRRLMLEPVILSETAKSLFNGLDISVNVNGGGAMAQARAVRGAIAKGISEYSGNDVIKNEYMRHDRSIMVDDFRRVEPKKPNRLKARARFQTSYR